MKHKVLNIALFALELIFEIVLLPLKIVKTIYDITKILVQ